MSRETPKPERRSRERGPVAQAWSDAQRDAWRIEFFKLQVAEEAQRRRDAAARNLAVRIGLALGVAGCGVQYIFPHLF
jgi:hypothetical protein